MPVLMKKTRKIAFLSLAAAAALTVMPARAYDFAGGGVFFNITNTDTHEVAVASPDTTAYSGVMILPSMVNYNGCNYAVTSIATKAFYRSNVTEVIIPNSVTEIGELAFAGSAQLRSITLPLALRAISRGMLAETAIEGIAVPEQVDSIAADAFNFCMQLQSVFLPASLKSVGDGAFAYCENLYEIYSAVDTCACAVSPTAFEWAGSADFTVPSAKAAQALAADTALNASGNLRYYSFGGQEVTLGMTPESEDYNIVPTNLIADGEPITVRVEANATTGITAPAEEVEHPTIHVIDGTIYISGDNYGKWTYVYDAYGNLYYQRPAVNNIIGDLPRNRVYIVRVGNYTKKIFL